MGGNLTNLIKTSTKQKSNKFKLFFILIFIIILGFCAYSINRAIKDYKANKHINLSALNTKLYINAADTASENKLQVNWQYLAAIEGVKYKNNFSKVTNDDLSTLANMFITNNPSKSSTKSSSFLLLSLDEVLTKLNFTSEQKQKVKTYVDDLKSSSTIKNNISTTSDNYKFIQDLKPYAIANYEKYGILPSIAIAQAILETGWGSSKLYKESHNLFGIKADKSWKGPFVKMATSENYNDKIMDNFRVYKTKEDSIVDYGVFLNKNSRYRENGVFSATTYIPQAKAIEKAGYSTKSDKDGKQLYSSLLTNVIKDNNLQLIDTESQLSMQ